MNDHATTVPTNMKTLSWLLGYMLFGTIALSVAEPDEIVVIQEDIAYVEFTQTVTKVMANLKQLPTLLMILRNNQYLSSQSSGKQAELWQIVQRGIDGQQTELTTNPLINSCNASGGN